MPDNTLTTQTPTQPPHTRPVPPSWASVAPLLARWFIALMPYKDGTWDVLSGFPPVGLPRHDVRRVPWPAVPAAIADVAARCEADAKGARCARPTR